MAEHFRLAPILLQRQVEHRVERITGHLFDDVEERGQRIAQQFTLQRRVRLQQYQTLASAQNIRG